MIATIELRSEFFHADRRLLARGGSLIAHTYRYSSGVEALEIDTGKMKAVLLPFKGQQIWDCRVGNRQLTMQSPFDEPLATTEFLKTYGAYFVHCGASATGSPSSGDDHALHGELPNIRYERAALEYGRDDIGAYLVLTGQARYRNFFGPSFAFRPRLRVREGGTTFELSVEIENVGADTMPLMYLAHINFRPVAGGRLVDTMSVEHGISWTVPTNLSDRPDALRAWHEEVTTDFDRHRQIGAKDRIEKEFGFTASYQADTTGWAHALQVLPDGTADFVSFQPRQLPRGSRWLSRAADRQALGLCLPATARPVGRGNAEKSGQLMWLSAGDLFKADIVFGALDRTGTASLQKCVHETCRAPSQQ